MCEVFLHPLFAFEPFILKPRDHYFSKINLFLKVITQTQYDWKRHNMQFRRNLYDLIFFPLTFSV